MQNIEEIKKKAKENKVPIIDDNSLAYIIDLIKKKNINNILELGTATGYSAISFALSKEDIHIITIERDIKRYEEALENVNNLNLNDRIKLINDDIFNTNIVEKFDLIFIDAAKSQNAKFLDMFKNNLNKNGIIIIDNMGFHGLVNHSEEIKSKNLRSLVRKIENFIEFLNNQREFKVEKINIGDILYKLERNNNE